MNVKAFNNKVKKELRKMEDETNYSVRFKETELRLMKEAGLKKLQKRLLVRPKQKFQQLRFLISYQMMIF